MGENRAGHAQTGAMQHGGPEKPMEINDILADEMIQLGIGRRFPVAVEVLPRAAAVIFPGGDIADGRIEPDVEVFPRMARYLKAKVG